MSITLYTLFKFHFFADRETRIEEEEEEEEERERKEEKIRTHGKNALFSPAGGFVDLSFRIFKIVA